MKEAGIGTVIFAAMGQAFFTLSIGIGALSIFGSYIGKERALTGEAISVGLLDTTVAIVSGLIIFPACFAFGINPGEGPGLVFVTLPNVFNEMAGGRVWGSLFFLFMTFAAFSTIIAVFQNIITFAREMWGWSLQKSLLINGALLILLGLPCILGLTDWSGIQILGKNIMDFEDFLVSNNLLPLGSLIYLLFCVTNMGGDGSFPERSQYRNRNQIPGWPSDEVVPYICSSGGNLVYLCAGIYVHVCRRNVGKSAAEAEGRKAPGFCC